MPTPAHPHTRTQTFVQRRIRRNTAEIRIAVESVDERIIASQARMIWARDARAVQTLRVVRDSITSTLGANVAQPQQIELTLGEHDDAPEVNE